MWSLSRANIRKVSATGAKETDSDPPNESPCAESTKEGEREREAIGHQSARGFSVEESIFLSISWEPCTVPFTKERASPLTAVITFAAETSTIDYRRTGIICTRPTSSHGEFEQAADVHSSHVFHLPLCAYEMHTSCVVTRELRLVINFLNRTTTRRVDVKQKRNVIFHSSWR